MLTAWKYRAKILAEQSAAAERDAAAEVQRKTTDAEPDKPASHKLLLTSIRTDCERISGLPRGKRRTELKQELLKHYLPVIDKYLSSGSVYRNTALTQVMIWCFDIGDIKNAMRLADSALAQKQPLPERFNRDLPTGIADFVLEWSRRQIATGKNVDPYFRDIWQRIFPDSGAGWRIPDELQLKYIKTMLEIETDPRKALALCDRAETLDPVRAQVKTKRAKLERKVAELNEQTPPRAGE